MAKVITGVEKINADTVDGKHADEFLLVGAKASDSDKLDGKDSSEFANYKVITLTELNSVTLPPGFYNLESTAVVGLPGTYFYIVQLGSYTGGGYRSQLATPYSGGINAGLYMRVAVGSTWGAWEKIGENASNSDKLDNLDSTAFMRTDQDTETTGRIKSDGLIGYSGSGAIRLTNPKGGACNTSSTTTTGAIKITLPVSWTGDMLRFTVKVYEYSTGKSFDVICGGYNYSLGYWINVSAYILSQPNVDNNYTIRFGHDGTNACVYIGETTREWSYTQIFVTDAQIGFDPSISNWDSPWGISITQTLGTISATVSNVQIGKTV